MPKNKKIAISWSWITKDVLLWKKTRGMNGSCPFYKTPEALANRIVEYFNWGMCSRKKRIKVWKDSYEELYVPNPSLWDLSFFLWFRDKSSLYKYAKRSDEFDYLIKRAKTLIEVEYEKLLHENPTAAIFALKNYWWSDVVRHEDADWGKISSNKIVIEHVVRRIWEWKVINSKDLDDNIVEWNLEQEMSSTKT